MNNTRYDGQRKFSDAQLETLAGSFSTLPAFEWNAGPLIAEDRAEMLWESKNARHISTTTASDAWFSRFHFRDTRVYVANFNHRKHGNRLDDLMRFTDALTYMLHPYRERKRELLDTHFNFGLAEVQADLQKWEFERPDIMDLLHCIIRRLEECGLICLPENRKANKETVHSLSRTRTVAGKIESSLVYKFNDLTDLLNEKLLAFQTLFANANREVVSLRADIQRIEKILADFTPARRTDDPSAPHNVCTTPGECAGKPEFTGPQFN